MHPDLYCQQQAAPAGSSAYYAFLFLSPERKRAMTALAALCRVLDAVVNDCREISVARMKLAWWRTQIDHLQAGQADHPIVQALMPHMAAFGLPVTHLKTLIEGQEIDLDHARYDDWHSLHQACRMTSGAASVLAAMIGGVTDPKTLVYAEQLGVALRLTHRLRHVGNDARRNRIYLPLEDLRRFDVRPADILRAHATAQWNPLMQAQAQRVRGLMRDAVLVLPPADRRAQRPGLILAAIAHATLQELARDGWQGLQQRTSLTPMRKFWLAWKTQVTGGRGVVRTLAAATNA